MSTEENKGEKRRIFIIPNEGVFPIYLKPTIGILGLFEDEIISSKVFVPSSEAEKKREEEIPKELKRIKTKESLLDFNNWLLQDEKSSVRLTEEPYPGIFIGTTRIYIKNFTSENMFIDMRFINKAEGEEDVGEDDIVSKVGTLPPDACSIVKDGIEIVKEIDTC